MSGYPHSEASRAALADEVMAAMPLIAATSLAKRIGMSIKYTTELLDRFATRSSRATHRRDCHLRLEVISRFCIDPRWLIYLPPTMSPSETSAKDGLLEHPDEAMAHFRRAGVTHVVVEEKHMGSRRGDRVP